MSVKMPIDNAGIINIGQTAFVAGFVPSATFAYNAGAHTLTVTDASTYPAGDDLGIMHIKVYDEFGGEKSDKITVGAGNKAVDVSALDALKGLSVKVTVVTDNGLAATGGAYHIGSTAPVSGSMRYWNKDNC